MEDSAVDLVKRWKRGDPKAGDELFRRYANRLIALARTRLPQKLAHRVDPEDVVHSAYRSFFAEVRDGRYDLAQGGNLWQLLVTITLHKLIGKVESHTAQKRSVTREHHFGTEDSLLGLQPFLTSQQPSPVEAVALTEELERLMRPLEPAHRRILELRLQGYGLEEIAEVVGRTERTVRRVLERVRQEWEKGANPDD